MHALIVAAARNYAPNNEYALNKEISVFLPNSLYTLPAPVCIACVMATRSEETFLLASVVRGHHVYKSVWMPHLGEHLPVHPEMGNNHDKYAFSIVRQGGIVGHVRRQLSQTVWHFLFHGGQAQGHALNNTKLRNR